MSSFLMQVLGPMVPRGITSDYRKAGVNGV